MSKYVFFTGGVVSGLGKGITAASLGALFKARGYSVAVLRFNPFFNIDSSNLSLQLHGEVYITEDGRSCDLVVGHYERILGENLHSYNDVTSGEIYSATIAKERMRAYGGSTVQVVPHITDEIKSYVFSAGKGVDGKEADIVIVEVGGTVGDIETQPYLEAIRQLRSDLGKNNVAYIHVSLVNYIDVSGEQKTKPTQHSVRELQNLGIRPDVIVCRTDYPLELSSRNKLSLFCNVDKDCIIENALNENIYEIPIKLEQQGLCKVVLRHLKMEDKTPNLTQLEKLNAQIDKCNAQKDSLKVGIISGFSQKPNAYISLIQAITLSSAYEGIKTEIVQIPAVDADLNAIKELNGLIIGEGISPENEKIKEIIAHAKSSNIPTLMIDDACLLALLPSQPNSPASSASAKPIGTKITVVADNCAKNRGKIDKGGVCTGQMLKVAENAEQKKSAFLGGKNTIFGKDEGELKRNCPNCWITGEPYRPDGNLGARVTTFIKDSMLNELYGDESLLRHRKNLGIDRSVFDNAGYFVSGISKDYLTVDAFESRANKFFVGVFFHPEFSVKAQEPSKLISRFLIESLNFKLNKR